jgi:hypothetical protein
MLTKEEARAAVEAELFALNLTRPMSLQALTAVWFFNPRPTAFG